MTLPVSPLAAHVMSQQDPEGKNFFTHLFKAASCSGTTNSSSNDQLMVICSLKERKGKDNKPVVLNGRRVRDRFIMWETSGSMQGKDGRLFLVNTPKEYNPTRDKGRRIKKQTQNPEPQNQNQSRK